MTGWIGVDLDGTLAEYHGWLPGGGIGKPIPKMVERVKQWLAEGKEVKIFTARASIKDQVPWEDYATVMYQIDQWVQEHIGQKLEITYVKDMQMIELWDDRAVQVIPNTGERADGTEEVPSSLEVNRHVYALALRVLLSAYEENREIGKNTLSVVQHLLEELKK